MRILFILVTVLFFRQADAGYYYVNSNTGNDTLDGSSDTFVSGYIGPKKTINGVMSVAAYLDTVQIANGNYPETVVIYQSYFFLSGDSVSIKHLEMNGWFENLRLIGGIIHVTDSLLLTDGLIYTGTGKLIASVNCQIFGGNIFSFVSGPFIIENDALVANAKFFVIGEVDTYRPVYLSFNQSTTDTNQYTGQFFRDTTAPGSIPSTLKYLSKKNHWFFKLSGPSFGDSYQGSFSYDSAGNDDEVGNPGKLRMAQRDEYGTVYKDLGGQGNNPYQGDIGNTVTLDSLGYYVLANAVGGTNALGNNKPNALFTSYSPCARTPAYFTDRSVSSTAPINRWHWNFGTGNPADTSALKNPTFIFNSYATYTVNLVIRDTSGFVDTYSMALKVYSRPVANYSATSVCSGDSMKFRDMSLLDSGEIIVSRLWTLNTGIFHYDDTVFNYKYPGGGFYPTSLILYTANSCTDTALKTVQVFDLPKPAFIAESVCFEDSGSFSGTGGNLGDTVSTWKWFVDGSLKSVAQNWKGIQTAAKTYQIMLAVSSQNNCADTARGTFIIYENPISRFALDNTVSGNDSLQCFKGNDFTILRSSYFPPAQVSTEKLYWGSARTLGGNTFVFASSGLHPVELVITTDKGCADSSIKSYKVFDPMTVNFSFIKQCIPLPTKFKSVSTTGSATISNYRWEFGDDSIANVSIDSVIYNYTLPAIYSVQLTITSSDGCVDSVSNSVTIDKTPVASFTTTGSNPFCSGDSLQVTANGGSSVVWDDADTIRNRVFYASAKRKVTVFSGGGCSATDSITVTMNPSPIANAGRDTFMIKGNPINLNGAGGNVYRWEPAANCTSPDNATTGINISDSTNFVLRVTDLNGCMDYDTVMVYYIINNTPKIPNLITPNNDNQNDNWDLDEVANIETSTIKIFTNFGKLVWSINTGYDNTWKGTAKDGKELPNGTYLYIIENTSNPKFFKGYLQILR